MCEIGSSTTSGRLRADDGVEHQSFQEVQSGPGKVLATYPGFVGDSGTHSPDGTSSLIQTRVKNRCNLRRPSTPRVSWQLISV